MKISVELIQRSPQYMNALREHEISLRGLKIPHIENLGATLDQFECIDLSHNEITKLEDTAPLRRLNTILLSYNHISKISPQFGKNLPYLENLVLTNNNIRDFSEIANLTNCKALKRLSLIGNLVTQLPSYRYYVIHKLPQLAVLDFHKVKLKERQRAAELFGTETTEEEEIQAIIERQRKLEEE
eukprot:CAMPEP_0202949782 /NCGR_PEP_ID=MMETSP1395-20130829/16616_1 /ASSEMBLY_ACC=CAM_ASM_000871 /TAXON_ID=5961 /ORGANISM="Blepharisma japonicum, Strain Stock R1072" /LENGTH=184 /DNA_ID=CAMNT_0049653115 /DNA_START=1 /DNA_END=552 /DNA_ORIENTATION=+